MQLKNLKYEKKQTQAKKPPQYELRRNNGCIGMCTTDEIQQIACNFSLLVNTAVHGQFNNMKWYFIK